MESQGEGLVTNAAADLPELIRNNPGTDCLHVFFIPNPVAAIMSLMIVEFYELPRDQVYAVSMRHSDTSFTNLVELPLEVGPFDRYANRLTGRNMAAIRLKRRLKRHGSKYIVYASWHYSEIEEVTASSSCLGTIIFEEGQLTYYEINPYRNAIWNTWRFRKGRIAKGLIDNYLREDAAAFVGLSPDSFPGIPGHKKYVLDDISAIAGNYEPQLTGIRSIGLMPAPRRLSAPDIFPAVEKLIKVIPGRGVVKLHPGYRSERHYSLERFSELVENVSDGRVSLCPEDTVLELEMLAEEKVLYGARTSLSRYAKMFGSQFHEVEFDNYIRPSN